MKSLLGVPVTLRVGLGLVLSLMLGLVLAVPPFVARAASRSALPGPLVVPQFRSREHVVGFQTGKVHLVALDHALSVEFAGARPVTPDLTGAERATYSDLWDGISATFEAASDGIAKSAYHLAPGAAPAQIKLRYNVPARIDADGSLVFEFSTGRIRESAPVAWQDILGERVPVPVAFQILNSGSDRVSGYPLIGFATGAYDARYPLTIDPTFGWHTFYGATNVDMARGIALDAAGNIYVVGESYNSWNGLASGGSPLHAHSTVRDIVVLKLNSAGAYQWHTFYGSTGDDYGWGIAVDGSANVYAIGYSAQSWNGTTSGGAPLHAHSGGTDVVVLKLDTNGAYQWHTFYGSADDDWGYGIATDASNQVYLTGASESTFNGPSGQTPLHVFRGYNTNIVTVKLSDSGAYQWHTFYGEESVYASAGNGITVDASGNVLVVGESSLTWKGPNSTDAPLHAHSGGQDITVLKLTSAGAYQWHTFYGSSGTERGFGIVADANGAMYITGRSYATWNGPTSANTPLHAYAGDADITVLKLNASGAYQWHTFYGSATKDYAKAIALDSSGGVVVVGVSNTAWNGPGGQTPVYGFAANDDIFLLSLNGSGTYQWHSFFGGSTSWETGHGVAVATSGSILIAGDANGAFTGPGSQAPLHAHSGSNDLVIVRVANVSTNTTLTSAANPSPVGQSVTFTATVSAASGTPTGTVTFTADGTNITGCVALPLNGSARATCATSALARGSHSIVAVYSGENDYQASTSTALMQIVGSPLYLPLLLRNTS